MHDRRMRRDAGLSASPIDRSQTSSASTISEFVAGAPVLRSHRRRDGAHHQRLDEQRHHIMVVGKVGVDPPHRGGIGIIPSLEFLRRHPMRLLEAAGQRLDQPLFHRAGASRVGARQLDMLEAALGRAFASSSPCSFQVRL